MKDWTTIRERYLRDDLPIRLGGLAANLARIKSFANQEGNYAVVESLLEESKFFIEWTANDAEIDTAAELVDLQIQLAGWQRRLPQLWTEPSERAKLAEEARHWSTSTLNMSGLLQ